MRINTNIGALNAQRNLQTTGSSMAKSIEKLSSGLRINRAADDAAGLSISEKLRAQVRGLSQAQRNAQDGVSMIQTAEGALTEVHSMLQRMRELSLQAANDTLSTDDRTAVNTEMQQLEAEVNAISVRTQFNGKQLLTGSLVTQVAAASEVKVGLSVAGAATDAVISALDVKDAKAGDTFTFTYDSTADTLTLTRSSDSVAQTVSVSAIAANGSAAFDFSALGVSFTIQNGSGGALAADEIGGVLTTAATDSIATDSGSGSANFQIGANASDFISVSFQRVDISASGLSGLETALTNFDTTQSVGNAQALVSAVDTAITTVNEMRSNLGAVQNRLEHTIANVGVAHENLSASESRIRDTDMAAEMVSFTRSQILQQAGMAILSQANQSSQSVLSLLR